LNLQTLFLERVPYPPSATAPVGTSPCSPLAENFSHHLCNPYPGSATGGCPPPSLCHINRTPPPSNEEAPFPQGLKALFERVLRKKHADRCRDIDHAGGTLRGYLYLMFIRCLGTIPGTTTRLRFYLCNLKAALSGARSKLRMVESGPMADARRLTVAAGGQN